MIYIIFCIISFILIWIIFNNHRYARTINDPFKKFSLSGKVSKKIIKDLFIADIRVARKNIWIISNNPENVILQDKNVRKYLLWAKEKGIEINLIIGPDFLNKMDNFYLYNLKGLVEDKIIILRSTEKNINESRLVDEKRVFNSNQYSYLEVQGIERIIERQKKLVVDYIKNSRVLSSNEIVSVTDDSIMSTDVIDDNFVYMTIEKSNGIKIRHRISRRSLFNANS